MNNKDYHVDLPNTDARAIIHGIGKVAEFLKNEHGITEFTLKGNTVIVPAFAESRMEFMRGKIEYLKVVGTAD